MEDNHEPAYTVHKAGEFSGCCRSGLALYGVDGRGGRATTEFYTGARKGSDEFGYLEISKPVKQKL